MKSPASTQWQRVSNNEIMQAVEIVWEISGEKLRKSYEKLSKYNNELSPWDVVAVR